MRGIQLIQYRTQLWISCAHERTFGFYKRRAYSWPANYKFFKESLASQLLTLSEMKLWIHCYRNKVEKASMLLYQPAYVRNWTQPWIYLGIHAVYILEPELSPRLGLVSRRCTY